METNWKKMLRDQLVCGVNDERIQWRLLAESQLEFKKAMELATAMEMADKNTRDLQNGNSSARENPEEQQVNQVTKDPTKEPQLPPRDSKQPNARRECFRCGGQFQDADKRRYKNEDYFKCHKKGHKASKCCSNRKPGCQNGRKCGNMHHMETAEEEEEEYTMFHMTTKEKEPYRVKLKLNGIHRSMEVDTGAAATIINEETYKRISEGNQVKNRPQLETAKVKLRTYTGEVVKVIPTLNVIVKYEKQEVELKTLPVEGCGPYLLGRDWLKVLTLNWKGLFKIQVDKSNQESPLGGLIDKFSEVFEEGLGTFKGPKVKIHIDPEERPKFLKARPVPYTMTGKIEVELKRLQDEGTIEPVQFSEWAAPIVPILKPDDSFRICRDYKSTVNQVSKLDSYLIPMVEDLLATLKGGEKFTKLDMSQAYLQLDDESKQYTTINTHKGLFQYTRLPCGISMAPGVFQRNTENLLQNIPYVIVQVDDILVSGASDEDDLSHLEELLKGLASVCSWNLKLPT